MPMMKRKRQTRKAYRRVRKMRKRATVGTVKRMIGRAQEQKWIGRSATLSNNWGGVIPFCLNAMPIGAANDNRLGDKIFIKAVQLKVTATASANLVNKLRILVFSDKQSNQSASVSTGLFAGGVYSATTVFQPRHPDFWPSRYRIHLDRTLTLGQQGGSANLSQEVVRTYNIYPKLRTQYVAGSNTGTATDISKNGLWVLAVSDEATAPTEPAVAFYATIRFTDS